MLFDSKKLLKAKKYEFSKVRLKDGEGKESGQLAQKLKQCRLILF